MRKVMALTGLCLCVSLSSAAEPTAVEILARLDDVIYAAKDKESAMRFTLIEKNGKQSVREMVTYEKGADKRLMKFTAPADQKGIAFLSLPDDVMYFYLPAFAKTRRIASSVKNTKFAGTDLTYENLEAKRFSLDWNPELIGQDAVNWQLKLTPKPKTSTEYSFLKVTVRKENHYPVLVEYFDKAGGACKTMMRDKVEKIGTYWEARETMVEDLKTGHKTRLEIVTIRHDTNIADEKFTERFLTR